MARKQLCRLVRIAKLVPRRLRREARPIEQGEYTRCFACSARADFRCRRNRRHARHSGRFACRTGRRFGRAHGLGAIRNRHSFAGGWRLRRLSLRCRDGGGRRHLHWQRARRRARRTRYRGRAGAKLRRQSLGIVPCRSGTAHCSTHVSRQNGGTRPRAHHGGRQRNLHRLRSRRRGNGHRRRRSGNRRRLAADDPDRGQQTRSSELWTWRSGRCHGRHRNARSIRGRTIGGLHGCNRAGGLAQLHLGNRLTGSWRLACGSFGDRRRQAGKRDFVRRLVPLPTTFAASRRRARRRRQTALDHPFRGNPRMAETRFRQNQPGWLASRKPSVCGLGRRAMRRRNDVFGRRRSQQQTGAYQHRCKTKRAEGHRTHGVDSANDGHRRSNSLLACHHRTFSAKPHRVTNPIPATIVSMADYGRTRSRFA